MSVNDITGDSIKTGAASADYRKGYDAIWGVKQRELLVEDNPLQIYGGGWVCGYDCDCTRAKGCQVNCGAKPCCTPSPQSPEYLARSRAVIRDYWVTPEAMFEKLDLLEAECKAK